MLFLLTAKDAQYTPKLKVQTFPKHNLNLKLNYRSRFYGESIFCSATPLDNPRVNSDFLKNYFFFFFLIY